MRPLIFLSPAIICLSAFVNDAVATPNSEKLVVADDENNEQQNELQRPSKVDDSLLMIQPSNVTGNFTKLEPGNNGLPPLVVDDHFFDDSSSISSTSSVSSASQVNSTGWWDRHNMKSNAKTYEGWFKEGLTATQASKWYSKKYTPLVILIHPFEAARLHAYPSWVVKECLLYTNKKAPACADQPIALHE